jgi:predicted nucleic acid-binding protein
VPEPLYLEARSLLDSDHELLAPDILRVEAANALLKKVRQRELTAEDAREVIEALPRYLRLSSVWDVFEQGVEVALQFRCTLFDGLYLALALQEGCPLVTGDARLVRTLPASFADGIVWLGDLAPGV